MAVEVCEVFDDFMNACVALSATAPLGPFGLVILDTSSSGTPTYIGVDGAQTGEIALTIANTSEAEIVTLYAKNILNIDIDLVKEFEFEAKVSGIDSATTLVMGLAGDQNDAADSVAQNAWFRMEGSASTSNVVVETDDGTTDLDDKATGQTLSSTKKRFKIDFTNGKSDVRFYMTNSAGQYVRVAPTTTFDMSAYSGSLQPLVQIQKASGTGVPAVTLDMMRLRYKRV